MRPGGGVMLRAVVSACGSHVATDMCWVKKTSSPHRPDGGREGNAPSERATSRVCVCVCVRARMHVCVCMPVFALCCLWTASQGARML